MPDIIDTRDLHDRLAELEERAESIELLESDDDVEPLDEDEQRELAELQAMRDEIADWRYGEALIPEDKFEDYARDLAEDIGAIDRNASWPLSHIDWAAAADELRQDYSEYVYDGTTYLAR